MCGTLTSLLGQAAALMVIETVISPSLGMSTFRIMFDFVAKGIATYWVYKYAQCTGTSGTTSRPLSGMNAMTVIVGGLFGAGVLALSSLVIPNNVFGGMDFMGYILEAIILHFAYGMGARVIADLA